MKKSITLLILTLFTVVFAFGQAKDSIIDAPQGLRIMRNGHDYLIYADHNLAPNFNDYRKINNQVFFRLIDYPVKVEGDKKYQLITIPGPSEDNEKKKRLNDGSNLYPRVGKTVNKEDYDQNFWIESDIIEKHTGIEHYRYANAVFSGLLTAPFKYRLKIDDAPESIIDGDFNIAPFIGWKWRVSSTRPFYVAPFGFAGVTSLNYNSANNDNISDSDILENGVGLTYGLGLSFRFGSVSPGFIIGWDKGFGNLGSGFMYNNKTWISFSVNYDFFKPVSDHKSVANK